MSASTSPHWPKGLARDLTLPQTSLYYNLTVSAARYPDKDALIYYDSRITYGALRDEVDRLAGFLQARCGVQRGDRVLLFMQNSPQFVIAYYAVLRADAVAVPVSPLTMVSKLEHYIRGSEAAVAIAAQELFPQLEPHVTSGLVRHAIVAAYSDYATANTDLAVPEFISAPRQPIAGPRVILWKDAMAAGVQPAPHLAGPEDPCVLAYTSGTEGEPKGCVHVHASVMMTAVSHVGWMGGVLADTVVLAALPFFHVTGMQTGMNAPIYGGHTIVLLPRWDSAMAARMIERYRVTDWTNIATMVVALLADDRKLAEYNLSSIERIGGGGAPMPAAIAQKLFDTFGLTYIEGYGLTETMAPTHMNPPQRAKQRCLGIPIFNTDVRVIDPQTREQLGANQLGEIVCHGPQLFRGYWKNDEATAKAFIEIDGKRFFRTGDLGYADEEGYFFFVDRLKRMINVSGNKVSPTEVEKTMYANPDILEVCVISAPRAFENEAVKALVVLKPQRRTHVTEQDIIGWCRERLEPYCRPSEVEFREALPKSATGKVNWRLLQEEETAVTGR